MLRSAELGNLTYKIDQYDLALCWWIESAHAGELKHILNAVF